MKCGQEIRIKDPFGSPHYRFIARAELADLAVEYE